MTEKRQKNNTSRKAESDALSDSISDLIARDKVRNVIRIISQILFVAIGVGAAYVSFSIEQDAFYQITRQARLSLWIVLIFESAKIGTVVIYERGYFRTDGAYSEGFKLKVRAFKYLLFTLSFICSLAVISLSLDRPNLEKTRTEDIREIENRYTQDNRMLQTRYQSEIADLKSGGQQKFDKEYAKINAYYDPKIIALEADLRKEMENTDANGNFIGKRYLEFRRRLAETKAERDRKLADLNRRKRTESERTKKRLAEKETMFRQELKTLSQWREQGVREITTGSYANDERAANRLLSATLRTLNDGILTPIFGIRISQVVFSTLFSLVVAILIEMTIYISMSSVNLRAEESEFPELLKKKPFGSI